MATLTFDPNIKNSDSKLDKLKIPKAPECFLANVIGLMPSYKGWENRNPKSELVPFQILLMATHQVINGHTYEVVNELAKAPRNCNKVFIEHIFGIDPNKYPVIINSLPYQNTHSLVKEINRFKYTQSKMPTNQITVESYSLIDNSVNQTILCMNKQVLLWTTDLSPTKRVDSKTGLPYTTRDGEIIQHARHIHLCDVL